jgi:hypothetical protein
LSVHAVSQQTPSTQWACVASEAQSVSAVHAWNDVVTVGGVEGGEIGVATPPSNDIDGTTHACVDGSHTPAVQSAFDAHAVLQLVASAHVNPPMHGALVAAHAAVVPSQLAALVSTPPAHAAALHDAPFALYPQLPIAHRDAHGPVPQTPCGSVTPSTATHVPSLPAFAHV